MQNFLGKNHWDEDQVARKSREIIRCDHGDENAIIVIEETSDAKKGDKTVGVKRQHCGATGKKDNCVVFVHLGYVAGDFAALADSDLFLPEDQGNRILNNAKYPRFRLDGLMADCLIGLIPGIRSSIGGIETSSAILGYLFRPNTSGTHKKPFSH